MGRRLLLFTPGRAAICSSDLLAYTKGGERFRLAFIGDLVMTNLTLTNSKNQSIDWLSLEKKKRVVGVSDQIVPENETAIFQ